MYFNVYKDEGSVIEGYLIPDGFSSKPRVFVDLEKTRYGPFDCDIFLPGPFNHKHHATGIVGFEVNEDKVPGLQSTLHVEVGDEDTGTVFYRRFLPGTHRRARVFRLETQFIPHNETDQSLKPYFQFHAEQVERHGTETVRQMLEIAHQSSTYVSGRVLLKSVQPYLTEDTIRITSLRDPFYELAVRLWVAGTYHKRKLPFVSERDAVLLKPAFGHFASTDFSDFSSLQHHITTAPKEILELFSSPFTHQLVAANPTDVVRRDGLSSALDVLSQFTIFSSDEDAEIFAGDIAETLDLDRSTVFVNPLRSQFISLANRLREIKVLEYILENDLILYYFIARAKERAASDRI